MKKIILAGNSSTAEILYQYLKLDERYNVVGITVDEEYINKGNLNHLKQCCLSNIENIFSKKEHTIIMAIGYSDLNRKREKVFLNLKSKGYKIETYIHPKAIVLSQFKLGDGTVILPNAVIEPFAKVGENTIIWSNVTIAHHANISKNCWLASGSTISGMVNIKKNTFIGVNATIVNDVAIEKNNIIGASAMISKNTKSNSVYLTRSAERLRYEVYDYLKIVDF